MRKERKKPGKMSYFWGLLKKDEDKKIPPPGQGGG
jgi:hypothetical protein